jgi:hypothetical protein
MSQAIVVGLGMIENYIKNPQKIYDIELFKMW